MECLESCCRNWTSAHVAYFSASACVRWIVKANNNSNNDKRENSRRRNCSKGPGRIFVYLLHILGFYGNDDIEQVLWQVFALPQQWHSREPQQQQHNTTLTTTKKGYSYSRASAPTSAPFWFYAAYLLIAWKLARELLSPSPSLSVPLSVPVHPPASIRVSVRVPARVRTVWLVLFLLPGFSWLPLWQFIDSFSLCVTFEMLLQCLIWMQRQIIESFSMCLSTYSTHSFSIHAQPHTHLGENILFKNIHNNSSATR